MVSRKKAQKTQKKGGGGAGMRGPAGEAGAAAALGNGDKNRMSTIYRVTKRVTEPTKGVTDAEKRLKVKTVVFS